jgi:phage repressor protein C with HTH and peptisase S24 domain
MANRIREWRLRRELSMQALAERIGTKRQQIHKLERGERRLSENWLRRIAAALACRPADLLADDPAFGAAAPLGEEAEHVIPALPDLDLTGARPVALDRRNRIPVYASAQGGPDGTLLAYEPIEYVDRPEPLFAVRGAFAMYVVNDSMEPKYSQGALLLIHPGRPVRHGDYVLIVKRSPHNEHSALVKQLVRMDTRRLVVRQFNPPKDFSIPRREVAAVHLVIGSYEAR